MLKQPVHFVKMKWHYVRSKIGTYIHETFPEFIYFLFLVTLLIDPTAWQDFFKISILQNCNCQLPLHYHPMRLQYSSRKPIRGNVGDNRQGSSLAWGDSGSGKKSDLKFNKYFRRALYWQIVFDGNSNNRLCFKRGWLVFKSVRLNNVKSEHGCQTDNSEKEEEGKKQLST